MTATETATITTRKKTVAAAFGLKGDSWMRHANPASVWTRFAALPMIILSVWSRDWIGWWCLVPIVLSNVWLMVNPLFFSPPTSTRSWASRGVLGERVWTEGDRTTFPAQFSASVLGIIQALQGIGLIALVYGVVVLDPIVTVTGLLLTQVAKCWYIDRMVLLFDDVKTQVPEYAAWDY
jgi:hypothetical protein